MLMSAAAEKLGLSADDPDASQHRDLDEARRLITALAGLVTASAEYLGPHAGPVRDGLKSLQLAFREASAVPDEPGQRAGRETHRPGLVAVTQPFRDAERISSRPMTLTSPPRVRPTSTVLGGCPRRPAGPSASSRRCRCSPSVSPLVRRDHQDSPGVHQRATSSTSPTPASPGRSCWHCWPPRWPRANASPGGSSCSTWSPRSVGTSPTSLTGDETADCRRRRRDHRPGLPRRRGRAPGPGAARSSGPRCAAARCSRRRRRWSPGWPSAFWSAGDCWSSSPARWHATTGWPTRVNRVSGFAGVGPDAFTGQLRTSSSTPSSACSARWR